MSEQLLPFYDQELASLRRLAGDFADAHPKIAGRLRLSADAVDDPHVARLLEGFAFIAARIRQKLDDEFPELTDSLLGALYPHLLCPFPSAAIARFAPVAELSGEYRIGRGTMLEMEPVEGESCRYRTTQAVSLWPVAVVEASLSAKPLVAPPGALAETASGALRLVLECLSPSQSFSGLGMDRLRFFLHGLPQHAAALYELLGNNLLGIALADHPEDQGAVFLPPEALRPCGFDEAEGLLDYDARSFAGYRLLTEYMAFPAKFLFIDVQGLSAKLLRHAGRRLELFFYFDRLPPGLARQVTAASFVLGAAPVVNLFDQRAEPVALTHERAQYLVVPDARRHGTREVQSIDRVTLSAAGGIRRDIPPFFASHHAPDPERQRLFWTSTRTRRSEGDDSTDVMLSVVDAELSMHSPADGILTIETTCSNRDLPKRVPYGGGRPLISMVEGAAEVTSVQCITPLGATLRPAPARRSAWRLISHLTLNHLSLTGGPDGADALREILRLHDLRDVPETHALLDAIVAIDSTRATARLPGSGAMVRGLDVTIEMDARRVESGGVYLFAAVLDRFLALYVSINSFSRLTVRLRGREETFCRFAPRAGTKALL